MRKTMWEIRQQADPNVLDLYIYGDVEADGYDWWTDEVIRSETSANAFRDAQFWGSFGNVLLFTACGLFFGNVSAIALAEMLYGEEKKPGVAINEAVELVKKYGADNDHQFVNGLLGSVAREQEADPAAENAPC